MIESLKAKFLVFSENHYVLAILLRFLLAILVLIIVIKLLGFLCALIYALLEKIVAGFGRINTALDGLCAPGNKSSNPWGMVLALSLAALFYFAPSLVKEEMKEFWVRETVAGIPMHRMWGIVIASLVVLTGVFTAKLRFPVVLFAKLVRIPLDLLSVPFRLGCWITAIAAGLTGFFGITGSQNNNTPAPVSGGSGGVTRRIRPGMGVGRGNGTSRKTVSFPTFTEQTTGYVPTEHSAPESAPSDFSDGFSYFGEQHTDQYRASQEGGADGYSYGRTESGQTVYYSGEYRPFPPNGENVEYYHLDEDCTPMDKE